MRRLSSMKLVIAHAPTEVRNKTSLINVQSVNARETRSTREILMGRHGKVVTMVIETSIRYFNYAMGELLAMFSFFFDISLKSPRGFTRRAFTYAKRRQT
jgi:hypothetical protein